MFCKRLKDENSGLKYTLKLQTERIETIESENRKLKDQIEGLLDTVLTLELKEDDSFELVDKGV